MRIRKLARRSSIIKLRPHRLQQKFLFAFLALVLGLVAALSLVVERRQRSSIIRQMEKRGVAIATHLAAVSTKSLLTYNFVSLEQDAEKISQDPDVLYAIILDRDNRVATYSGHDEKQGMRLRDPISQRSAQANTTLIQRLLDQDGNLAYYDITVPIFIAGNDEKWGAVRLGLSLHDMYEEIYRTRWQLFLLGLLGTLAGSLVAAFLARRIAAPIHALAEGANAVARGDMQHLIPVRSHDEIAVLASNFNHMTTELGKHRAALEQTNERLDQKVQELSRLASYNQNILTSMASGLFTLDLEGCVETFNAMAETITGLRAAEVKGMSFERLFADNLPIAQIISASRQHRASLTTTRLDFCRRDGHHLPLSLRTAMLQDHTGETVGLLAIFEDLSPLQTLEQRLYRADRLAALGQMAAGIAHEVKNPLASIRTFVQLVGRRHTDLGFIEKFDRVVPRELDRIHRIIEEMLELARPSRLQLERIEIVHVLQRVIESYSERMRQQQIELKTDFATALPPLRADVEQLYRAFANITLNAIEAMTDGGELTITCRTAPKTLVDFAAPGSRLHLDTVKSNPEDHTPLDLYTSDLEVLFSDSGPGIPSEQLDMAFTPFHTTKPKGTGLGLAITHKIIEEHRGSLQITSRVGHGTTVMVQLPAAPPHTA